METSYYVNRGIVYWTERENEILRKNINKKISTLRNLLPSRTDGAIYQKQRQFKKQMENAVSLTDDFKVQRVFNQVNQDADSISFKVGNVNIVISFQK
jgi:hypothetical protein